MNGRLWVYATLNILASHHYTCNKIGEFCLLLINFLESNIITLSILSYCLQLTALIVDSEEILCQLVEELNECRGGMGEKKYFKVV